MCLSVPAKILEVDVIRLRAKVEYFGTQMVVGIALLEQVEPDQYVLVHAGEAIQVIDEEQAQETLELWKGWIAEG
ncbi:HypC/HybG/HupF family hydrogenase formation chaperone [Ammoniphilus sp. CFH 90114]|uniref:HypC/HybG/HupF family hydrogenase formation chaperone n=1 Tax=Ammoniphilus sp. CFH 90114 TaxID=2493665 RepID=UPI00100DADDD|nr:HypC/HybG/HupF family hydrogenase formation chaperone [Ammoniphilus sp. CFH 90114]RXT07954.1 HypC/HybG/HupF family hydrogenase formation chaperone [Ammoniphilus sp. CFH 90114]